MLPPHRDPGAAPLVPAQRRDFPPNFPFCGPISTTNSIPGGTISGGRACFFTSEAHAAARTAAARCIWGACNFSAVWLPSLGPS